MPKPEFRELIKSTRRPLATPTVKTRVSDGSKRMFLWSLSANHA